MKLRTIGAYRAFNIELGLRRMPAQVSQGLAGNRGVFGVSSLNFGCYETCIASLGPEALEQSLGLYTKSHVSPRV